MRFLKFLLVFYCLTCSVISCFAGDAQWVEVRSPNFSVITDAGEKKGRQVAFQFEQMRAVFGKLMEKANVSLPVRLQVVALRNHKEIEQCAPVFNGKPTDVSGLFLGGEDVNFILLDTSAENAWQAVFHEYAHRLLDGNLSIRTDPWFEEGFAEYFSTIEVDSKEARVGKIPDVTGRILHEMGMMKVADLLRVQQNSKTYNENGDHRTTFYAESSLLVHYLYDNGLIAKLAVYFQTLQKEKKSIDESLQASIEKTSGQLDKVLGAYLFRGTYRYFHFPTPVTLVASQFTAEPMTAADGQAVIAEIHAYDAGYQNKALGEFEAILQSDPSNWRALRGAGVISMRQGNLGKAIEYLRKAEQQNGKDPRVHYYYAKALSREGFDAVDLAVVKRELQQAIDLDPGVAEPYSMLGYAQMRSGEPDKAVASLTKAVKLAPTNDRYLLNLGNAYLAARKPDVAIQIFHALEDSRYPGLAEEADRALQQAAKLKEAMLSQNSGSVVPVVVVPPILVVKDRSVSEDDAENQENVTQLPQGPPLRFLKGKLLGVDCSASPQAILIVAAGAKTTRVHIQDIAHFVLIGADKFSCDWKEKNLAINYRDRTDGDVDAVSIEVQ